MTPDRKKSAPFYEFLKVVRAKHDEKGESYEGLGPVYANYRRLEKWVPAITHSPHQAAAIYAMMRLEEKLARVRAFFEGSTAGEDTIRDTFIDLAVIPGIAQLLYEEAESGKANSKV